MYTSKLPPEAESIVSLTRIAGIIALVIGILMIIIGLITLIFIVGIFIAILGAVDILIYTNCKEIISLVESGDYRRAKDKTLVWMILGFIFSWIIVGVLLLVAYLKYDDLIRRYQGQTPLFPQTSQFQSL
ncbi:MAG: hypothetical protein QXE81_04455 [Desulfurococcaceae archaeon]